MHRGLTLAVLFATGSLAAQAQNVDIGTTAPTQTLDVNGQLHMRVLSGSDTRLPMVRPDDTLGVETSSVAPLRHLTMSMRIVSAVAVPSLYSAVL